MIPLFLQRVDSGSQGAALPNPIYYITKSVGPPNNQHMMAVFNVWDIDESVQFIEPDYFNGTFTHPRVTPANWNFLSSRVEVAQQQTTYNTIVEPYPERDGSLAGEPQPIHRTIRLKGVISFPGYHDMSSPDSLGNLHSHVGKWLMVLDPRNQYLGGASVLSNTIIPHWEPFYNIGFGILAWYDPSAHDDWRIRSGQDFEFFATPPVVDDIPEYARLNRFMFARSIKKPVTQYTKYDDVNVQFEVQFLIVDPRVYEFIAPATWFAPGYSWQLYTDESAAGENLTSQQLGSPTKESNEEYILPTYPWTSHGGPGWREVSEGTPT